MSFSTEMILIPADRIDQEMISYLGDKFKTAYICPVNNKVSAFYFDIMMLTFDIESFVAEFTTKWQCDAILYFNAEDYGWTADHYKNGVFESTIRVDYEAEDSSGLLLKNLKGFEPFMVEPNAWLNLTKMLERLQGEWEMEDVLECVASFTAALGSEWLDLHNYKRLEADSKKKLREMGITEINLIKKVNPVSVVKKVCKKELASYGFYIGENSYAREIRVVKRVNGFEYGLIFDADRVLYANEYHLKAVMVDTNRGGFEYCVDPEKKLVDLRPTLVKSEEEMVAYVRSQMKLFLEKGLPWLESFVQMDFDYKKIFDEVVDPFMAERGCVRVSTQLDTFPSGSVEYGHGDNKIMIGFSNRSTAFRCLVYEGNEEKNIKDVSLEADNHENQTLQLRFTNEQEYNKMIAAVLHILDKFYFYPKPAV